MGQCYSITFFSWTMILVETQYMTHKSKFCTKIQAFRTWCHYLQDCKYGFLILSDYDNLFYFMDTKNLISRQIYYTQKLSIYHFPLILNKTKLTVLTTALDNTLYKVLKKKPLFNPEIWRPCSTSSHSWQNDVSFQWKISWSFIKSWYAGQRLCLSYVSSETLSWINWDKKNTMFLILEL